MGKETFGQGSRDVPVVGEYIMGTDELVFILDYDLAFTGHYTR